MSSVIEPTSTSPEAPPATAPSDLLQPRPDEAQIGPLSSIQTVQGIQISTPVTLFLALLPVEDKVQAKGRVVVDLSDLQNKVGALIDTIPLPTDNCQHFGPDNIVARIWGKRITIDGEVATLTLNGDVDIWECAKNPVLCSRIEWDEHNIFGGTIRTPRVVLYDCNPPIKIPGVNQPFEATLPFQGMVADQQAVAVKLGDPTVNLGGTLGGVTEGILKIAGVDINIKAKELLDGAIRPDLLRQTLPTDLLELNPTITRAQLLDNQGALALYAELTALADLAAISEFLTKVLEGGQGSVAG